MWCLFVVVTGKEGLVGKHEGREKENAGLVGER